MTETNSEQPSQSTRKPESQDPTAAASRPATAAPTASRSTTEEVITAREPARTEAASNTALKQKVRDYGESGKKVLANVWTWLNDLVSGRHRYELLPAGIYVLRLVGVVVAILSLVYPLIDLQVGGVLGWFLNLVANVAAGFLALVAAEALATLRDLARASDES